MKVYDVTASSCLRLNMRWTPTSPPPRVCCQRESCKLASRFIWPSPFTRMHHQSYSCETKPACYHAAYAPYFPCISNKTLCYPSFVPCMPSPCLMFIRGGMEYSISLIGRATFLNKEAVSPLISSWTSSSSETLMLKDPNHHLECYGSFIERGPVTFQDFCLNLSCYL